jgi:hypothetical protein
MEKSGSEEWRKIMTCEANAFWDGGMEAGEGMGNGKGDGRDWLSGWPIWLFSLLLYLASSFLSLQVRQAKKRSFAISELSLLKWRKI